MPLYVLPQLIGFDSIPAFLLCILILFALSATPLFSAADTPPDASALPRRLITLDGLRGFLALAVAFHHVAVNRNYAVTGVWSAPTRFYASLGGIGVVLFFCITGFLFWSRLLREEGHHRWLNLYLGRIFRLGPLFVAAFIAVAIVVFALTGPRLAVSPWTLVRQLSTGLFLGIRKIPNINGFPRTDMLLDGVEWTLQFEWFFYLSLPLLAFVAATAKWRTTIVLGALFLSLAIAAQTTHLRAERLGQAAFLFLTGMLSASIGYKAEPRTLSNLKASMLLLFALTCAVIFEGITPVRMLCTGLVFYLVTRGCTLFGLFLTRPARRLGDISYGIYLLQGLPHALLFRIPSLRNRALASPAQFWALALLSTVLLTFVALLAHVAIERPGIRLGRYLDHKLHAWKSGKIASQAKL